MMVLMIVLSVGLKLFQGTGAGAGEIDRFIQAYRSDRVDPRMVCAAERWIA
jgi:hypothetical protein